jgi:NitT/TauT family transport system permease protein
MLIGLSRRAEAIIEPVLDFIRYTPIPAFVPLFILWFGIGELEKTIIIASSVFFQIVLLVANSISLTPKPIIASARTLGATQSQLVAKVIYPFAKPRILDDLRVCMGWAWAVLTIAEIVGATSGIGFVIIQSQRLLQTANVLAAIVVVGVLGLLTDAAFKWLYKVSFPWASRTENHAET